MAYISRFDVKKIRDSIKKKFPNYKFSIFTLHHCTIMICILRADLDPINNNGDSFINHYYIKEQWSDVPRTMNTLLEIQRCILEVKECKDRNYGDVGADYSDFNYFYNIRFGSNDFEYERF